MKKWSKTYHFEVNNTQWLKAYEHFMWLDSGSHQGSHFIALGAEKLITGNGKNNASKLSAFLKANEAYAFGYFSYEWKNQLEKLQSENPEIIGSEDLHFFVPRVLLKGDGAKWQIYSALSEEDEIRLIKEIEAEHVSEPTKRSSFLPLTSKSSYLSHLNDIKRHIQLGDVYELNYCQAFQALNCDLNPYETYFRLRNEIASPMSVFARFDSLYSLSVSPERFLKKQGRKITSEPIKGTIKRARDKKADDALKESLRNSLKDRSENLMIVDLVRNDLSRIAQKASVQVEELCAIYSFPNVHQMISRVSCLLDEKYDPIDVLAACFPMGSMTGAPKISAMKLIERHEDFKRGLYSGSMGYFSPEGDFDFNVLIRSLFYDSSKKTAMLAAGGAITILSDAEQEYQESLLKIEGIRQIIEA